MGAAAKEMSGVEQLAQIDTSSILKDIPPNLNLRDSLMEMADLDPLIFALYYRRLRQRPYVFDISHTLDRVKKMFKGGEISEIDYRKQLIRHRPFLIKPLRDQHPHKAYRKSRQMGVSENSVTETIWFLKVNDNTKWIYTFPREKQLIDFSNSRIREALKETPRMRELIGDTDQTFTKTIGKSWLFLRSAWEENLGEGIDADGVTFDEKDRMRDGVNVAFEESLQSSPWGYVREVSTPSLPGRGIDEAFQISDQQNWFVRCSNGHVQTLSFPENIMQLKELPVGVKEIPEGTYRYACAKDSCRAPIDRNHGEWVAKYPDRKLIRGYQISQLMAPWISADKIHQKKIKYKYDQPFYNYVIGVPSVGGSMLVSDEDIKQSISGHQRMNRRTMDWSFITIGIDWGHLNWLVVRGINAHNGRQYILDLKIIEDDVDSLDWVEKDLVDYIKPWAPDMVVCDGGYGKDRNAILMKAFNTPRGRTTRKSVSHARTIVYACDYNPAGHKARTHKPVWSEESSKVLVNRFTELKNTCHEIKSKKLGLPKWDREVEAFGDHLTNLAPILVEDEEGMHQEISKTGDDHFAHADNYSRLGMEKVLANYGSFSFSLAGTE